MVERVWIIALVLDILDFAVGWIPGVAEVVDFVGVLILYRYIHFYALIDLAEIIPVVNMLPLKLVSVYLWKHDMLGLGR